LGRASEEQVGRASDVISRQVRHMTSLVDDLLDVSRVTRGLIQLERKPIGVGAIVASAVEQARPLVEAREHVLLIEHEAGGATVVGDANRLVQVIVNLLNNAAGASRCRPGAAGRPSRLPSAITASASMPGCYPMCSTCSPRPSARRTAPRAASGSGSPWSATSSPCMAAR
jgi:nitrogen fixation/metabolism regulation signal transduction histidine kinase